MKSFPFIHQHDEMQCGIACLQMICANVGLKFSAVEMEKLCPPTTEGVSMLAMSRAAKNIGFSTTCARLTLQELGTVESPCILHLNQCHFVVLYKVRRLRNKTIYYIADPAKGKLKLVDKDMRLKWISTTIQEVEKGVALILKETSSLKSYSYEPSGESASFKNVLKYIKGYRTDFLQIAFGMAIGCVLQILFPILTQCIVDYGIGNKDINFIYAILCAQIGISMGTAALDLVRSWIMLHVCAHINIRMLNDFLIRLFNLTMPFFDVKSSGDMMQRMGDHNRVQSFLTSTPLSLCFSIISFITLSGMLLLYDATIFVVFALFSIINALWVIRFLPRRRYLNYEMFEKQAISQNRTLQLVTSMQEIKLQNCQDRRRWEWEDSQLDMLNIQELELRLTTVENIGSFVINSAKNILVIVLSAKAVIDGNITFGMMLAIQSIVNQMSSPISLMIDFIYSFQSVKISMERINEIRHFKSEKRVQAGTPGAVPEGTICLKNISFKYDVNSPVWTLKNISFIIPQGKIIAVVGTSGSGKTTLLKLLLGYYENFDGAISIGGIELRKCDISKWRDMCGVVMQEGKIFTDTIARNIAASDDSPDNQRLVYSTQMACIYDYIKALPLGFNTIIGQNGKGLSMGQKQRIMLARAIYKNPKYLFLDEATNSLDTINEKKIIRNLEEIFKDRTVFVIAHRLSTIKNADHILVMEDGEIVESGSHNELMEKQSHYYQLVKNQIEL